MAKVNSTEMECAVARFLNPRANLIVPNVSWGMGVHECDLFVLTNADYAWEVEIKVSKADLKKDAEKWHGHVSNRIRRLYFAVPDYLSDAIDMIPDRAGVLVFHPEEKRFWKRVTKLREAETNKTAQKLTDVERYKLARLGALRIWALKRKLISKVSVE